MSSKFITEIVAAAVDGVETAIHEGGLNARPYGTVHERRKAVGSEFSNGKGIRSSFDISIVERTIRSLLSGGEGSGCDPAVAESHGTVCGPKMKPKSTWSPAKEKEKFEKYAQGLASPKMVYGLWQGSSDTAKIFKELMTGEWKKLDALQTVASQGANVENLVGRIRRSGMRLDTWSVAYNKATGEFRLLMKQVQDQAVGTKGIPQEYHQAALKAVQQLIGNNGLDATVSKSVMDQYAKDVGLKNFDLLASSVDAWTSSPNNKEAQYLKRVAADYYGNDWSKEYKGGYATDTSTFKYAELKEQALAIKALSNAYMQAKGIQYLYRGLSIKNNDDIQKITQAAKEGKAVAIPLNSLSGFSSQRSVASSFASTVVVRTAVNPEEVWVASGALPHLFDSYAKSEKEYIVGSKSNTVAYFDPKDVWIKTSSHEPDWVLNAAAKVLTLNTKYPATYDEDHLAAFGVPKGGSICSKCKYVSLDMKHCSETNFINWEGPDKPKGSSKLPKPADEYCSDWFIEASEIKAATESALAGMQKDTLWHGIQIKGFTGPEEEGLRAMLSRVPPELLFAVKEIVASPELNAKHGQYLPDTKTIKFNPSNFILRQRFGKGEGWLLHQELTTAHEVGHSIYRSMSLTEQDEWKKISNWMIGWQVGQSLPYEEKRPGWPKKKSEWTHKAGVKFTRHYAERNPDEDFADCFAFYLLNKGHQMEPAKKAFLDCYIKAHVKKYPSASIQSPSKPYAQASPTPKSVIASGNKNKQSLYNNIDAYGTSQGADKAWDTKGRGRKGKDSDKVQKALATYVPQDKNKIALSTMNEVLVAKAIGGTTQSPVQEYRSTGAQKGKNQTIFDVYKGKIACEVKTLHPTAKNDKLTCHPESCGRKIRYIKKMKLKAFTIAVDMRDKPATVYLREGVGSFRLGNMTKVGTMSDLSKHL